jgi:ribosomal protein S3AE
MAKNTKNSKKVDVTLKKKKWFPILSPLILGEKEVGETFLEELETAVGRTIDVNLMQVTGDMKSQNISVKFEVTEAKDQKIFTRITEFTYLPSSVKRLIRRKMTRLDDSVVAVTKDGKMVRIKPMASTRSKVSSSVERALRAVLRQEVIDAVTRTPYDELFVGVIKNRIQNEIKAKLSKVYPIKIMIIRVLKEETHHSAKVTVRPSQVVQRIKSDDTEEKAEEQAAPAVVEPQAEVQETSEEKPKKRVKKEKA